MEISKLLSVNKLPSVGIDLIEIENLKEIIARTPNFVSKILTDEELKDANIQTIAGKIAAKEAIIKTGYIGVGEWHKILILSDKTGKPYTRDTSGNIINNLKISISHTDKYAVAVALLC